MNKKRHLYDLDRDGETTVREAANITPYLTIGENMVVESQSKSIASLPEILFGNMPNDGGRLLLEMSEAQAAMQREGVPANYVRRFVGSQEFIRGTERRCIWITDAEYEAAQKNSWLASRFEEVRASRAKSSRTTTNELASVPYRFGEVRQTGDETVIIVPGVSSESREYLPVGYLPKGSIVSNLAFALYDAPLWNMALIASRLHLVWIATVCGKLKTDFRYSNTLGWNTFPVPMLTEKNKADLTRCAEDILLAREHHFPATIADLYDPENMPADLRAAHERNDEVLERIYIGRRFKNDTERLEKLFNLYTKMTASAAPAKGRKRKAGAKT